MLSKRSKPIYPSISFLIPTYNAERYLQKCLDSIKALNYPQKYLEIIVADGGSNDTTRKIATENGAVLIDNPARIAESGKLAAFKKSHSDFIVFLDADNIIAGRDWASKMLSAMHPSVVGVESNYLIAHDFSSLNTYANLLIIVDPLARLLASKPTSVTNKQKSLLKHFDQGSIPVSGANGFMWKRSVLEPFATSKHELNEVGILNELCQHGEVEIGNVPNNGIYHYYCDNLVDYTKKRFKIADKHTARAKQTKTWVAQKSGIYFTLCVLYLATIIGPAVEAFYQLIKTKRISWLWHPLISTLTIVVYTWVYIKAKVQHAHKTAA